MSTKIDLEQTIRNDYALLISKEENEEDTVFNNVLLMNLSWTLFLLTSAMNLCDYGFTATKLQGLSESQVRIYWAKEDNRSAFHQFRGIICFAGRELAYLTYK
ncbi:MAG: hypothetical protein AABX31_04035 [Nanoarchaeota archaeon]